jgi:cyclohexanecarboxylate-CoA ligase
LEGEEVQGVFLDDRRLEQERSRGIWPDRVLTDYFDRWVEERPDDTALIAFRDEDATTTRITWRELARTVTAIARGLAKCGVAKGDVVSFQLPNWWEFVAVHLACVRIGAVSNPLMPIFRHRELSFMVAHAESKVLIAPTRFRGFDHGALALTLARELPSLRHVFLVGGEGDHSFADSLLAGMQGGAIERGARLGPNDVVQLLYTSGTTGEPKGAMHTSNTLIGTTLSFAERMQLASDDVVFMPSPLAHQIGFEYGMLVSVLLGAPLVLLDIWSPERAVELLEEHRATYMFAATPFLADLASFPNIETRALDAFRVFVTSGAPIPPVLVRSAQEKLGAHIVAGWGMTECGILTTTDLSGHKVHESDGYPLPHEEVRIVDEQGNEVLREQEGTLKIRGPALFVGYLKRPKLYDIDAAGWFDTGDIARMDLQGYIRICGRKKDIIIRGGENIPVVQIESALYKMPQVAEVAIVSMPDLRLGERACAFVVLRPGGRITMKDVRSFLADEGVAKQFWPERLETLEQMPRTPTGKIQKFALREIAKGLSVHKTAERS